MSKNEESLIMDITLKLASIVVSIPVTAIVSKTGSAAILIGGGANNNWIHFTRKG
jgi:hypothetical protein